MTTLCMDTSHKFLVLALIQDEKVLGKIQKECWKQQSEEIFPCLEELMKQCSSTVEEVEAVVITDGPGSYTGVRIAMTIAKVFCSMKKISLYTLGSLELFSLGKDGRVVMDARGKRVYTTVFQDGKEMEPIHAEYIEELMKHLDPSMAIYGDGHLLGKEDVYGDLAQAFLTLQSKWKKAENIHLVKPEYLKDSDAYRLDTHHDA